MTGRAATAASAYDWIIGASELLAEIRRHGRVVAERLVQVASVGPVVAGGHLTERGSELAADALGLGHQRATDAALTRSRVDHEGEDPNDPIVVFEARHRVQGDEAEHRALVLC